MQSLRSKPTEIFFYLVIILTAIAFAAPSTIAQEAKVEPKDRLISITTLKVKPEEAVEFGEMVPKLLIKDVKIDIARYMPDLSIAPAPTASN